MREKELRLALICYGGVSLAIYMHGVTREAWHLIRASRNFHEDMPRADGSQGVYRDLMEEIEAETGVKMRVLADIIAGSSAGGINGIFLAQAIATGQSLEPLTDLWLDTADVDRLIDPDARPLSRFSKFWATPIAWALLRRKGSTIERTVEKESRDEVATKLSRFVRARWFAPPFGGAQLTGLLLDALGTMAKTPTEEPLIPHGQPLDLFVTVTDFFGHEEVLHLNSPQKVSETEHRLTISFSSRNHDGGQPLASIPELVFSARATASFPGAFPPFVVSELDRLVKARRLEWPNRENFLKRILPQHYAAGKIDEAVLVDGSILANAPFNQAIDALRNRPARREIDRRFVYIDPKPGLPSFRYRPDRDDTGETKRKLPGWFATIFGATSNIPREQPIRDALEKITGRSRRIERLREVTEGLHSEVERTVETLVGKTLFLSRPTPARLEKWRGTAQAKGAKAAGYSYPAYGHLKLAEIIDDIARTARRACPQAGNDYTTNVREAVWSELRRRGLDHMADAKGLGATKEAIAFFRLQDVRFRIRRLRFLARRLADQVENKAEGEVTGGDVMHDALYDALALLFERETADFLGEEFADLAAKGQEEPGPMIDKLAEKRDLEEIDRRIDAIFCDALMHLDDAARRTMLLGYLGYPLYDIATLPLLQGEGLDEFDPVKVDRISPDDALSIRSGGTEATLKGIQFNNFGAFFSRSYRENDYLWGRLHGAERFIDILLSALSEAHKFDPARALTIKKRAFGAILDQEEKRLKKVKPLIKSLRKEIAAIVG
ncbi:MAG: patatin-like protein [Sphingorhabdus sp.]